MPRSRRAVLAGAVLVPLLAGPDLLFPRAGLRNVAYRHGKPIEPVATAEADWQDVVRALGGQEGELDGNMAYRLGYPRTDLRISSRGFVLNPELGLGTYISFVRYADQRTMLMGDMMVTEVEVQRTLDVLSSYGIACTALHKHLLAHRPPLWWIHLHAVDSDPLALARGMRDALQVAGPSRPLPPSSPSPSSLSPERMDLDTEGIDAALGSQGTGTDVYKVTFFRKERIIYHDRVLPRRTGGVTDLVFQPVGDGRAVLLGEFAMVAGEVQGVLDALRRHGISAVELHSHMLMEEPRMFFLHIWAVDDAVRLARGLRAGVDLMQVDTRPAHDSPPTGHPGPGSP
ncbi:peptidase M23 [Streptomyces griseocarneus]|nr:peptidase M23 [Streptomyces griseocarneus]